MKEIVIYGAGGVGKGAAQIVRDINRQNASFHLIGFLEDRTGMHGSVFCGLPVLGDHRWLAQSPAVGVIVAVASPGIRRGLVDRIKTVGRHTFVTIIHPTAWVADDVAIGEGSIVYPLVCINADARLGAFTILNMHAVIGHDASIGDYVTMAPGAKVLGCVQVSRQADLGAGSIVLPGVKVSEGAAVGAGAVVTRDLPPDSVSVGIPAKVTSYRKEGI